MDALGKVDSSEALQCGLEGVNGSADICELEVHECPERKLGNMRSVDERLDALTQKGLAMDAAMKEFEKRVEAKLEDSLDRLRMEIQVNGSQLRQGIVPLVQAMALEQLDLKSKVDSLFMPAAPFTTPVPCKSHGIGLPVVERIDVPASSMALSSRPLRPVPESCASYAAELPSGCSNIDEAFKEFQEQCTGVFRRLGEAAKIEDKLAEKVHECSHRAALAQLPSGCSDIDEVFKEFQEQCTGAFKRWGEVAKFEGTLDEKVHECSHRAALAQEGLEALQSEMRGLEQRLEASFAKKCTELGIDQGVDATTSRTGPKSSSIRSLAPAAKMQDQKERPRWFQDNSLLGVPFSGKADSLVGISYSAKDIHSHTSSKVFGGADTSSVSPSWPGALSFDGSGEYSGPFSRRRALPGLRCMSLPQLVPQL
eukprot:TRINITY_DN2908_c0_g1_i1.p1 TRINITY_DN2908_c0_g1~~TRINITY_DN2908_c0_g1_i1.p1  ORF type:complete len:425 (-),score=78.64 TRINITY_DN2908_c0_g1_i1:89-1363(-)